MGVNFTKLTTRRYTNLRTWCTFLKISSSKPEFYSGFVVEQCHKIQKKVFRLAKYLVLIGNWGRWIEWRHQRCSWKLGNCCFCARTVKICTSQLKRCEIIRIAEIRGRIQKLTACAQICEIQKIYSLTPNQSNCSVLFTSQLLVSASILRYWQAN